MKYLALVALLAGCAGPSSPAKPASVLKTGPLFCVKLSVGKRAACLQGNFTKPIKDSLVFCAHAEQKTVNKLRLNRCMNRYLAARRGVATK